MSLKDELLAINPAIISENTQAYHARLNDLFTKQTAEFLGEVETVHTRYPALATLLSEIYAIFDDEGYTTVDIMKIGIGASIAVGVLVQVAEIEDLPPVPQD